MSIRIPAGQAWEAAINWWRENGDAQKHYIAGTITREEYQQALFDEFGCRYIPAAYVRLEVGSVIDMDGRRAELEFEDERMATLFLLRWS